jgi:hypothetical protein
MLAQWWSAGNGWHIFDADVFINANWTYMKRKCVTVLGNCYCIGPFVWSGQVNNVASQHIVQPSSPANLDDAPASCLDSHHQLYNNSVFSNYSTWFSSGSSGASCDSKLHGLAPTASVLDLKTQPNGLFTSPDGNGLLARSNGASGVIYHPQKRLGFPHLISSTPHALTPFDGIYAIGTNNGMDVNSIPRPDNQYHVDDPQDMIGSYLANVEVAPVNLFLSNGTIGDNANAWSGYTGGYTAEYEARDRIIAGKFAADGSTNIYSMYSNVNYLTPNDDLIVASGTTVKLHCGTQVDLMPGFVLENGANLEVYIQPYETSCPNNLSKPTPNYQTLAAGSAPVTPPPKTMQKAKDQSLFKLYPNPSSERIVVVNPSDQPDTQVDIYDLTGKQVRSSIIENNREQEVQLGGLQNGIYLMQIDNRKIKLIINH